MSGLPAGSGRSKPPSVRAADRSLGGVLNGPTVRCALAPRVPKPRRPLAHVDWSGPNTPRRSRPTYPAHPSVSWPDRSRI